MSYIANSIRVLPAPVANPHQDKRKRNSLHGLAEFPAGRYFVDHCTATRIDTDARRLGVATFEDGGIGYTTILKHSIPAEPKTVDELLLVLGYARQGHTLLASLIEQGKITFSDIVSAAAHADAKE